MGDAEGENAAIGGQLIRGRGHGALATSLAGQPHGPQPYVSLVALACDSEARPLLLLSDLAQHTRNLRADPRVSLLYQEAAGPADPLAGARLTLLGRAERYDDSAALSRFVARHPSSAVYAGFGDFHVYRVTVERGHLVAGFGRIAWIESEALRGVAAPALAAAEGEIVAHMNADHRDALSLYAERLLHRPRGDWRLTGIDPHGIDLRRDDDASGDTARLEFDQPVRDAVAARRALVALAQRARNGAGSRA